MQYGKILKPLEHLTLQEDISFSSSKSAGSGWLLGVHWSPCPAMPWRVVQEPRTAASAQDARELTPAWLLSWDSLRIKVRILYLYFLACVIKWSQKKLKNQ
jgi:transcriptional regulator of nitric oxide reductase